MSHFKVSILFDFVDGPYGGGNQFLRTLRGRLVQLGLYEEDPAAADVVLINSHHALPRAYALKRSHPDKRLLHRVDGPISAVRGRNAWLDRVIFSFNHLFADGTVFQSRWSREACAASGMALDNVANTTISNAPDPALFNPEGPPPPEPSRVRIIATSWSANPRKGFATYRYLDENLDFSRYAMTFIGNSPVRFRNIRQIDPLPSAALAQELKRHSLFITASQNDPCSNALIEALHCGLPAVALRSGGHGEIIKGAGELFDDDAGALEAIARVAEDLSSYRNRIDVPTIDEVADAYLSFAASLLEGGEGAGRHPKRVTPARAFAYRALALGSRLGRVPLR